MPHPNKVRETALKAWDAHRWLTTRPHKVVEWADLLSLMLRNDEMSEGQADAVGEILAEADWLIWFCRRRLDGVKEKHALRVLALAKKAPGVIPGIQQRQAERFLGAKARWRREIVELEVGRMTDEADAD